jgi:hypothetical protein
MGIREDLEKYRTQGRERRRALIKAEDAAAIAIVKKENSPPPDILPKYDLVRGVGTTYSDLKPAKKRKTSGKLTLSCCCQSISH